MEDGEGYWQKKGGQKKWNEGLGLGGTHSGECAYGAGLEEGAGFEVEGGDSRGDGKRILANAPTGGRRGGGV